MAELYGIGVRKGIGVTQEVAFDTYLAATSTLMLKEAMTLDAAIALLKTDHVRQHQFTQDVDTILGLRNWTGKLECVVPTRSAALRKILKNAFGGQTDSIAPAPFTHTYKPSFTNLTGGLSLTMLAGDGVNEYHGSGGRVLSLNFKNDPAGMLNLAADLYGATFVEAAAVALPALDPPTTGPLYYAWNHATATMCAIGGSPVALPLSGFEVNCKFDIDTDPAAAVVIGREVPSLLLLGGQTEITGNLTRRWKTDYATLVGQSKFFELALAQTPQALVITFNDGSAEKIVFSMQVQFDKPSRTETGTMLETIPYRVVSASSGGVVTGDPFVLAVDDEDAT
jgi:hypothetical protein